MKMSRAVVTGLYSLSLYAVRIKCGRQTVGGLGLTATQTELFRCVIYCTPQMPPCCDVALGETHRAHVNAVLTQLCVPSASLPNTGNFNPGRSRCCLSHFKTACETFSLQEMPIKDVRFQGDFWTMAKGALDEAKVGHDKVRPDEACTGQDWPGQANRVQTRPVQTKPH